MCNRHAIRANVNKASKQPKRGECLPCERLVQGKRHMGKKALLALHFIALLRSQKLIWIFSIFTSSKFGCLTSRDEISQKTFGILTSGFGHNKITSNELETPKLTKRIEIHQLQITNNECSSLLSALQNSQVLNISTYAQLQHELIVL